LPDKHVGGPSDSPINEAREAGVPPVGRTVSPTVNERYSRQVRFAPIGEEGQRRIAAARVLVIGAGAIGSVTADLLVRAGVGFVRIVDRDFVDLSNLQRQSLYEEEDVLQNLPKAVAAQAKLRRINSTVQIDAIVDDVNPSTVEDVIEDVDLVLDALDNFETRFVVNDACAKHSRAWIYAAAVGSYGLVMPIIPGKSPCLRCMLGSMPAPGTSPTCETAGVIATITHIVASMQVTEALKYICGAMQPEDLRLITYDAWARSFRQIDVGRESMATCPLCAEGRLEYLNGNPLRTVTLCGRNAVQLIPAVKGDLDLAALSKSISASGPVQFNEFLLKCSSPPYELTVFKDGRAIVKGTEEPSLARSVYSKLIGV
jgi:molybdopterin-synthase adenylyltransferase